MANMRNFLVFCLLVLPLGVSAQPVSQVLVTLTSAEQQTRGMAMVLANTMQSQGARVSVLLCDSAGDMALKGATSEPLKPKGVTPEQLMSKLIKGGGVVKVCALYLPNSGHTIEDLADGIIVAKPPAMAADLLNPETRVFNF
ncbi:hypothetical protein [Marinobacterium litorale]|uniref:hypothetical protein n=1 Tax=Marinobacterium litorale TaxID=404770 RepID=UPI00040EF1D8|nr:hypothetical protein [Marinobacterium litorale]